MVAVIETGYSIRRIVNYHETKVKESIAECIGAINYPVDPDKMNINIKLKRFLKQLELNENVKRNTVHISLNFHASESGFPRGKLVAIAENYMEKIGFGKQPSLIYQHHDAAHPHIHIVSIKVRADGSNINMFNIGRNQSEPARKSIELEFGLVKAERQKKQEYKPETISVQRVQYGKSETKKAIQEVLDHVVGQYKYTSLPEFNAVLNKYNVMALRGSENSRMFQHKGLLYHALNDGKPVGMPIKASAFYGRPTLKVLEAKFKENEVKRMPHKARVKNAIDLALFGKKGISIQNLIKTLERDGVSTVFRQGRDGVVNGITYIDHFTKSVFNDTALGTQYSAKDIQKRCQQELILAQQPALQALQQTGNQQIYQHNPLKKELALAMSKGNRSAQDDNKIFDAEDAGKMLEIFMQPELSSEILPCQPKINKKRRKRISNNQ